MQQTSILAYRSLKMDKINERQKQVLEALEDIAPATNREVAERSMIPINVVTPRMGELVKKGMVVKAYINIDINGRKAIYWEPNSMRWNDEVADIA